MLPRTLLLLLALLVGPLGASTAFAHDDHKHDDDDSARRWQRKGPLAHLEARQRKAFHEEISYSSPFFVLGGLDLAAGLVVVGTTEYLEQGLIGVISGGLLVAGGFSVLIGTLVKWGIGPTQRDYWSRGPGLQVAILPGAIVGRW
mgnify:CR=1 FL=1